MGLTLLDYYRSLIADGWLPTPGQNDREIVLRKDGFKHFFKVDSKGDLVSHLTPNGWIPSPSDTTNEHLPYEVVLDQDGFYWRKFPQGEDTIWRPCNWNFNSVEKEPNIIVARFILQADENTYYDGGQPEPSEPINEKWEVGSLYYDGTRVWKLTAISSGVTLILKDQGNGTLPLEANSVLAQQLKKIELPAMDEEDDNQHWG